LSLIPEGKGRPISEKIKCINFWIFFSFIIYWLQVSDEEESRELLLFCVKKFGELNMRLCYFQSDFKPMTFCLDSRGTNKHSIGAHYMNLQFKIGVWAVWAVFSFYE